MAPFDSGWFAGPKAENAEWFTRLLERVAWDYYFWRRNYFPEDGAVLRSREQRAQDEFRDRFEDLLTELLGRLKGDCPFYSPRYAGHMVSEQTLPSIAGYFAAMLYNPNNVTSEAAPVTVELEMEAAGLIARMLGHGEGGWAHLCSAGTMANFEALWAARAVLLLPHLVTDVRARLGLEPCGLARVGCSPAAALEAFERLHAEDSPAGLFWKAIEESPANIARRGAAAVEAEYRLRPVVLVPETHHYCFDKGADLLGLGRDSLVRVPVDAEFRMDVAALERMLEGLEAEGRYVLAVVVVVGTTEEGAVDPVDKVVELRLAREASGKPSFWLHADAAYGGYLRSVILPERIGLGEPRATVQFDGSPAEIQIRLPEGAACDALAAMGECDSVTVDPHKLGYIPYPAGAVSFRDRRVKPLLRQSAPYLTDAEPGFEEDAASHQVGLYSLEGSKPGAVAAAVWLSHRAIPLDTSGHGALVRETIRQACTMEALLERERESPVRAVVLCPPGSNIVCYAFRGRGPQRLEALNALNWKVYSRFTLDASPERRVYAQRFFVSRTRLSPRQYGRAAVAPFLDRLGVGVPEFEEHGVFLLRSVLMNPWYEAAKAQGDDVLSRLVDALYEEAELALAGGPG